MNTLSKELEDSSLSIVDCDRIRYNERKGVFVDFLHESDFLNVINTYGWRCGPIFRITNKGEGLEGHGKDVQAIYVVFVAGQTNTMTLRYYEMERSEDEKT